MKSSTTISKNHESGQFALALSRDLGAEDPEGLETIEAFLKAPADGVPAPLLIDETVARATMKAYDETPAKHRRPPDKMPLPLMRLGPEEDWLWDPRHSPKTFSLDYLDGPLGYRIARAESDSSPLRKALPKARDTSNKIVWDLCGGYRVDALLMAHWNFAVHSWEKSPWVHVFASRALDRSKLLVKKDISLSLRCGDALEVFEIQPLLGMESPSIIYIDPMYPETGATALNQIEMRYLHSLSASEDVAQKLLTSSLGVALDRVVIKRPIRAPELSPSPQFKVEQGSTRYDIYLTQKQEGP